MFRDLNLVAISIRDTSMEEGLKLAKANGYEGFDPSIAEVETLVQEKSVDYVKDLFKEAGVRPGAWMMPVNWRGDDATYDEHMAKLPERAKLAAEIGCTRAITVVLSGDPSRAFKENWDFHIKRLRPPAEVLAEHGHRLAVEFLGPATIRARFKYLFLNNMDGVLALAAAIGTGNIGLLYDVWHAYTAHATLDDLKKMSNDEIVYVHINDAPAGIEIDEQIDNVRALPGETGVIPLVEMLRILKDIGYDGPITAEPFSKKLDGIPPQEAASMVIDMVNKLWTEAGLD
jgi:sugar phosphate isomerase/epimerase